MGFEMRCGCSWMVECLSAGRQDWDVFFLTKDFEISIVYMQLGIDTYNYAYTVIAKGLCDDWFLTNAWNIYTRFFHASSMCSYIYTFTTW